MQEKFVVEPFEQFQHSQPALGLLGTHRTVQDLEGYVSFSLLGFPDLANEPSPICLMRL